MATNLHSVLSVSAAPDIRLLADFKSAITTTTTRIQYDEKPRYLVHSPYTEREHQLDLSTLDDENALLAQALSHLRCIHDSCATAPYTESFNWDEVMKKLRVLSTQNGKQFKETSFYIVAFRSRIPLTAPSAAYEELGTLDKAAHAEANASGGFLKYWFGSPDHEGRNLATCLWRSRKDASKAGSGPAHRKASRASHIYSFWKIDRHRLIVRDGVDSWDIVDWVD